MADAVQADRAAVADRHWTRRPEGGGWFAVWLIRTIGLRLGRRAARSLLYPITLYFFVRRGVERRVSYAFLARAFGRPAHAWEVMRHIHRFASTILDRVFLLANHFSQFDVRTYGLDELLSRSRRGEGVLLLGSHVGSFEVLRVAATRTPEVKVCVVFDQRQSPALTQLLNAINPQLAQCVIDASEPGVEVAIAIGDALKKGMVVTILADRARPHEPVTTVDMFGAPAAFPLGPFRIAALLGAPVVLCFGMYRGGNRYDLHFEAFAERIATTRRTRAEDIHAYVQRYASRIEHHVRADPYNWFNWYDIWDLDGNNARTPDHGVTPRSEVPGADASMPSRATS
jgi:predicted LPLAT superfamily acyltransferase